LARAADAPAPADDALAATVNGAPISVSEVQTGMERILRGRQVQPESLPLVEAEVLAQLIDRRLVETVIKRAGVTTSDAELEALTKQTRLQAEQQKIVWKDFLTERHLTDADFREQLSWQVIWEKFLHGRLADADIEAFFQKHHQEFDGTEVRVSHVLLRPQRSGDPQSLAARVADAQQLREQISAGKISFEDAVKKHSAGPSREHGGDLGFISRHGVMVEPFAQAAFQTRPHSISQPVVTPFGVHLILVTEVKPGTKKWTDVRDQLKGPASQDLYQTLAQQERGKAEIRFNETLPHFKPGTKELVKPTSPAP
jgi:parvulin-like peptidyl-prolyl isomerase